MLSAYSSQCLCQRIATVRSPVHFQCLSFVLYAKKVLKLISYGGETPQRSKTQSCSAFQNFFITSQCHYSHIYWSVHTSWSLVLSVAHWDCWTCIKCLPLSWLVMMGVIGTEHGTTRGGGEDHSSSAANVFLSLERVGTHDCCFAKWELLSGIRRKPFRGRHCTQSPLLELEKEVWFHSGYGCQIYLGSSHVSHLFSSLVMAIFIILWCPEVQEDGG